MTDDTRDIPMNSPDYYRLHDRLRDEQNASRNMASDEATTLTEERMDYALSRGSEPTCPDDPHEAYAKGWNDATEEYAAKGLDQVAFKKLEKQRLLLVEGLEAETKVRREAEAALSVRASRHWHLGAQNDGLFIIDAEPHINTDGAGFDWPEGPALVLNVVALTHEQAQALVDAHNATVFALREKIASNAVQLAFSNNDRIELAKCREELVEMDETLRKLTAAASKARQALAGYLDPSQAAFELDVAMSKAMRPPPSDAAWPVGCIKRNSCARNKACMYGANGSCAHADRYIKEEVEAALSSPTPSEIGWRQRQGGSE